MLVMLLLLPATVTCSATTGYSTASSARMCTVISRSSCHASICLCGVHTPMHTAYSSDRRWRRQSVQTTREMCCLTHM